MEPLGQSQVFQYLQKLAQDHEITLVTYEKKHDWADKVRREAMWRAVRKAGIRWIPLRYHKRSTTLATTYDLIIGFLICTYLCIRFRVRIVHTRGYVISVLGFGLKRIFGVQFIFDMRCFYPDDILELGIWNKESIIYRISKWFERRFLLEADVVVALTQKAIDVMRGYPYLQGKSKRFEVITTCTNLDLFQPSFERKTHRPEGSIRPFTLGYVGNLGSVYLLDPMLECFRILKRFREDAHLLIINRNDHPRILESLQTHKISMESVEIKSVDHDQVPSEIAKMDAGIFFIAPHSSRLAAVPTKMGELLACGIPCLANAGVGNTKEILENDRVGVVTQEFGPESLEKAVGQFLGLINDPDVNDRCVSVAQRYFSLDSGVSVYDRIYRDLKVKRT